MRTSQSHPLQIASVSPGPGMGRIGITFCPGKKQPAAMSGSWDRDLGLDLQAIADFGASVLVTLIEDHEISTFKVDNIEEAALSRHVEWLHLPIADVSVPDAQFEAAWQVEGSGLRARLRDGFDIVVHCKGGLGRAGMIAARLLVELGTDPSQAIRMVRDARPGAIETTAQEDYVKAQRKVAEPQPSDTPEVREDRAIGALLGLAVGDAVGTTLEFKTRDSYPRLTDMIGGGPFSLKPGQWTDDTSMALALADSLLEPGGFDPADLMRRFVAWREKGEYSCTGRCFDIGLTVSAALNRWQRTGDPIAGSTDPQSAGNGSLMRLAPVPIRFWRDRRAMEEIAAQQSRTTHAAHEAVDACIAYANLIAEAIEGQKRAEVLAPRTIEAAGKVRTIMAGSWRGTPRNEIGSSGYVAHSLEAALWSIGRTADFRSAVLTAANLGGDADTTAAIAGQLAGAIYGASGIPGEWLEKLAWKDSIESKARQLAKMG